jgi:uncharacterized protein YdaU (DUF1376 family)
MNYYPFHIGDYASSTRHLTWDEDLAYRRLIDAYYTREAPIPIERRQVYRLVCASTDSQRQAVDAIIEEFFVLTEAGWVNPRCESDIEEINLKKSKASASANSRWKNSKSSKACERNASSNATLPEDDTERTETKCERIKDSCEGNAPNTNTKYMSTTDVVDKAPSRFSALSHLVSIGVDETVARDWIAMRRQMKASPSETAIDGIQREALKAGYRLEDALKTCCERGWRGFKAEWVSGIQQQRYFSDAAQKASAVSVLTGQAQVRPLLTADPFQGDLIEGEVRHVA